MNVFEQIDRVAELNRRAKTRAAVDLMMGQIPHWAAKLALPEGPSLDYARAMFIGLLAEAAENGVPVTLVMSGVLKARLEKARMRVIEDACAMIGDVQRRCPGIAARISALEMDELGLSELFSRTDGGQHGP